MRRMQLLVAVLLLGALLMACVPQAAPAPAVPAQTAWQAEWERVKAEAKKEGRVVLGATAQSPTVVSDLKKGFKDAFGIDLEMVTASRGPELTARILPERRAGLYNYDLMVSGTTTPLLLLNPHGALDPLDPLFILPDLTDPKVIKETWYEGKLWWVDKDQTTLGSLLFPDISLAINTNLVKTGEIKSYRDLLHPRWKGKIILNDPTIPGISGSSFLPMMLRGKVAGADFLTELAKQEPIIMRDMRLMLEWLSHGKMPILIAPDTTTYTEVMRAGAPIMAITPEEGTWIGTAAGAWNVFNNPPHPNAAKVFINWVLSKEGQAIYSRAYGGQSARVDGPTDHLAPEQIRKPGGKYWNKEIEESILKGPEDMKIAKEIFGHLMK